MSDAQIIGGHKATIHNANTSAEAKEHSKEVLKDEFNSALLISNPLAVTVDI